MHQQAACNGQALHRTVDHWHAAAKYLDFAVRVASLVRSIGHVSSM